MKRNKLVLLLTLFTLFSVVDLQNAQAKTITKDAETLYGKEATFQYNYDLPETKTSGDRELYLQWDQSELLKKPSAFTIQLDQENLKTIPLDASNTKKEVTVKLPKSSQKKGGHTVEILFSGVLKEGVCVDQNTSANWFTILPTSKLKVEGAVENNQVTFSNFSAQFSNGKTDVVISDDASEDTVNAAAIMTSKLQRASEHPNRIQLVQEKDWKKQGDHVIAFTEPKTTYNKGMKAFVPKDQSKALIQANLKNVKGKTVLAISTNKEGSLAKSMMLFTEPQLFNQLSGTELSMDQLPEITESDSADVKFKNIPLASQTLSNLAEQSAFTVYIPKKIDQEKDIQLQLKLKKSALLDVKKTELIVTINGTPFAVKLNDIQSTALTTKTIAIDPKQIDVNQPLNIQLKLNGAQSLDPCKTTNHNNWLYISNDSQFSFPQLESTETEVVKLNDFPTLFNQSDIPTIVQVPKIDQQQLIQIVDLYRASYTGYGQPKFTLAINNKVDESDDKANRILLGDLDRNPFLQKDALLKAGFIPENAEILASIDGASKNKKAIDLQILSTNKNLKSGELYKFIQQMPQVKNNATVMVKSNNEQIFSNEQQVRDDVKDDNGVKNSNQISNTALILTFVGLILLIIVIVYFITARRKKK